VRALLPFFAAGLAVFPLTAQPLSAQTATTSTQTASPAAKTAAPAHRATTAKPATKSATSPAAKRAPEAALTTDEQKTVYAVGLSIYHSLAPLNLSPAELDIIKRALTDAAAGKPAEQIETWGPKIQALAQQRTAKTAEVALAKAATEPGAVKAESGLIYREVTPGTGDSPKATDTVRVNYRGTLADGTEFDSSYKHNEPAEFPLDHVIPCWTEGLQKMKVGGKAVLVCPSSIAYGPQGHPPVIPGGAVLTFEIELLSIGASHPAPGVPGAAAAPGTPRNPGAPPAPGQPK
jgi:FKBP-type peptidyl-prolyl cis-trans isomerase FkpA